MTGYGFREPVSSLSSPCQSRGLAIDPAAWTAPGIERFLKDNCMYFTRGCLQDDLQDRESRACAEERSQARLYDPEEAILILPRAAASSAG